MSESTTSARHGKLGPHRVEVGIEFYGDPQRGRIVIEDALDLLMDRLMAHPVLTDPTIDATFLPATRTDAIGSTHSQEDQNQ